MVKKIKNKYHFMFSFLSLAPTDVSQVLMSLLWSVVMSLKLTFSLIVSKTLSFLLFLLSDGLVNIESVTENTQMLVTYRVFNFCLIFTSFSDRFAPLMKTENICWRWEDRRARVNWIYWDWPTSLIKTTFSNIFYAS